MRRYLLLFLSGAVLAVPHPLASQTTPNGDPSNKPGLPTTGVSPVASRLGAPTAREAEKPTDIVLATSSGTGSVELLVAPTPPIARPGAKPLAVPPSRDSAAPDIRFEGQAPIEAVQERSVQPFSAVTIAPDASAGVIERADTGASSGANASPGTPITPPVSR